MSAQTHPFNFTVGALRLEVQSPHARVSASLWDELSAAVLLESFGYERMARLALSRLQAFIRADSHERTWFLLRVMPHQERLLAQALVEKGIRTYVPLSITKALKAKRKAARTRALIPGYVFASLPDDAALDAARGMHGVIEIMCREGKPRRVPPMAIGCMAFMEACHAFDEVWEPPPAKDGPRYRRAWKPGDKVLIDDGGAFDGFVAEVKGGNNRDFMDVLITIFGRPTEVTIEHRHLVKPDIASDR